MAGPATTTGNAADLAGRTPDGGAVHLAVTERATTTRCWPSCPAGASPAASSGTSSPPEPPTICPASTPGSVAVTKGPDDESESTVRSLAPPTIPTVMSSEAWEDFGVPVAPYFILVDGPTGSVVGEGAATSWSHVRELLQRAMDDNQSAARRTTDDAATARPSATPT